MKTLLLIFLAIADFIPSGKAWIEAQQKRDSILVADQIDYGVTLEGVEAGTELSLQDFSVISSDTLTLVRNWQLDTLRKSKRSLDLKASVRLAPFEEGRYELPPILVLRKKPSQSQADTLFFDPAVLEVHTMPVDTATFVIHDIKPQMRYPVTFAETLPWIGGALLLALLIFFALRLIRRGKQKHGAAEGPKESPYIVALRQLDRFRSSSFWAPEKQKSFYSGLTDALKSYIDAQFAIDAPEMTTAELFAQLKDRKELTPELYEEAKSLFEIADFVKFAKHTASEEDNSKALPTAIRFVMSTYQSTLEEERKESDVL